MFIYSLLPLIAFFEVSGAIFHNFLLQLEELKSKDRLAWQKQKETSTQTDPVAAAANLLMVTPPLSPEAAELTNGVKEDGVQKTEQGSVAKNDVDTKPLESKIPVSRDLYVCVCVCVCV